MSEASSSSSSGSSSRSPSPVAESPSKPASTSRLNTVDTTHYNPPPSYLPSLLASSSDVLTYEQLVEAKASGKQLWTIKVPEGVDLKDLQGLKIKVPAKQNSSDRPILATLKTSSSRTKGEKKRPRPDNDVDTFHLYSVSGSNGLSEDAKNAQSGLKGKAAKKQGEKSQLIDEGEEGGDAAGAVVSGGGRHMKALRAYVPKSTSSAKQQQKGRESLVVAAPMAFSNHLEFVMAPPQPAPVSGEGEEQTNRFTTPKVEVPAHIETKGRKLRELKGYL